MNGLRRRASATRPAAPAMVHEARATVLAVDRALRDGRLAGPAEAYHVMGSLGLMVTTLQRSSSELATWLRTEQEHRGLTVVEGPFAGDAEAAVEVAAESLLQASRACREVHDALERAHIAMAHVGAEQDAARRSGRRSRWRRRGA